MPKRVCKIALVALALTAATIFAVFYYRLYTSPVFEYRGEYYETRVNDGETRYTDGTNIVSLAKTASGHRVTITYQWDAPQTFWIEQEGRTVTVRNCAGDILLQGIWENGALLDTHGNVDMAYGAQKAAWQDNRQASIQRPVPPNEAEALDIAMGAAIVRRGRGLVPKWAPLSLLLLLLLVGMAQSGARSSRRWGQIYKNKLHNPAWQVALQVDETGEPIRDVVFSKPWLVGVLYLLFLALLLAYDVS